MKKMLKCLEVALIIAIIMGMSANATPIVGTTEDEISYVEKAKKGDVNLDGVIDEKDVELLIQIVYHGAKYDEIVGFVADTNGDGKHDFNDILLLQNYRNGDVDILGKRLLGPRVWYDIDSDGTMTISGEGQMSDGSSTGLNFPDAKDIRRVIIKDGVTYVGDYIFNGCSNLKSVTIPDSVTSIGENIFKGCDSLEEIRVPFIGREVSGKQRVLGQFFVRGANGEKNVTGQYFECSLGGVFSVLYYKIPSTLKKVVTNQKKIPFGAFSNCKNLQTIVIEGDCEKIGDSCFYGCTGLTEITIPDSVLSIGKYVLCNCSNLEEISIPFVGKSRNAGGDDDGVFGYLFGNATNGNYSIANQRYSTLNYVEYSIPTSLKNVKITDANQIPFGAFDGCRTIEHVELNDGVTSIAQRAFANCGFLSVTIPKSVKNIGQNVFAGTDVTKLYVYKDSYAHNYAKDNNYPYELIDGTENDKVESVAVTGVELDCEELQLMVGETKNIVAEIYPQNATDKNVTWSTSDSNVATVDNGKIKAVGKGTAIITVKTSNGGYQAKCYVTVEEVEKSVAVTGVELDCEELQLTVGETKNIVAEIYPQNATDKNVTWSTSNSNVATVDNGKIKAVGKGTAIITVKTSNGGYKAKCYVTVEKVEKNVAVTGVELDCEELQLTVGETKNIEAEIYPRNATDKNVTWSTSNSNVATVDNGKIKAVGKGTATVTVKTSDGGYKTSCMVVVEEAFDETNKIILKIGKKEAKVFGKIKTNDVAPKIVNSRTMLPARFVAESLGAVVVWNKTAPDMVLINKADVNIIIYIGSDVAFVNGKEVKLDSPAFIENGRTYMPVRFISEGLGAKVDWSGATQEVIITK